MPFQRFTYQFTQRLAAPRAQAYRWATDYRASDLELGGLKATRKVERLGENVVLLTDSFDEDPFDSRRGSRTTKVKLVHLYPDRWAWVSTHVAGPVKHSQFLYELTPLGSKACTLHFTGSQVERVTRPLPPSAVALRARQLRREDSQLWVRLAGALASEKL
jgi:hypothetical protein